MKKTNTVHNVPLKTVLFFLVIGCISLLYFAFFLRRQDLLKKKEIIKDTIPIVTPSPQIDQKSILQTPILMYHYVEYVMDPKDTIRKSLDINPQIFEKQLKTLIDAGYTFLTMSQIGQALDGIYTVPEKRIVLTFDDGYKDFYTDVYPFIKKYGIKCTVYIITGFIGKQNYMSSDDIKEIAKSGYVDVGAHTVHHPNLKGMNSKESVREITESKQMLETLLGQKVVSFAYPYGAYDDNAKEIVKNAGYTTAVVTPINKKRIYDRWSIDRIRPGYTSGTSLFDLIHKEITKRE